MTGNALGERFKIICFGESHGPAVGVVIDGCPAGLKVSEEEIKKYLRYRYLSREIQTERIERDKINILSGIFNGYTTGAPIAIITWNEDKDSKPYEIYREIPRPGHADYTSYVKYGGFNDYRGGGRFSGRITASFVMAGAIAIKLLSETLNIKIYAYTESIGDIKCPEPSITELEDRYKSIVRCPDRAKSEEMKRKILETKSEGDTIGGTVRLIVYNIPPGLGEPVFSGLESDLSKAYYSIPGVKGVEFGSGFKVSKMTGEENNDLYYMSNGEVKTITNNAGGILGGISNGMPLTARIAFKPPSSIRKPQKTLNLRTGKMDTLTCIGRYDTCIAPRAVVVVESLTAVVLADHCIRYGLIKPVIGRSR